MITYADPRAYETIQRDIENSFYTHINKNKNDLLNIFVVGAFYGYEIVRFLNMYPNATINAFEAHPQHFAILQQNFGNISRVNLHNKVVSDNDGVIDFYELSAIGNGSILKFQGNTYGHPMKIQENLKLESIRLDTVFPNDQIDLLWVDVQGAELYVLKGTNTENCLSMFLEIHTHDYVKEWDKEPYVGQCYKEDLEKYLEGHTIHSIGLDNENCNGQGNSFWLRKDFV